jgi:hypothetical protein
VSQTADRFDGLFHRGRVTDNATEVLALKEIDDARDATGQYVPLQVLPLFWTAPTIS